MKKYGYRIVPIVDNCWEVQRGWFGRSNWWDLCHYPPPEVLGTYVAKQYALDAIDHFKRPIEDIPA